MKLLPLYFENEHNHVNGLSDDMIRRVSESTNNDSDVITDPKNIFQEPFSRTKNICWRQPTGDENYFYPVSCVFPLEQYGNYNRNTGYSFVNIPSHVVDDCRAGKAAVLLYETWEGNSWYEYMEMITHICLRNDYLRPHHFIVLSGNMNMPRDIPYKHVAVTWLQTILQDNLNFEGTRQSILDTTIRKDKFLCMNRRPAPHRLALLYHLWEYRDQGSMSFAVWEDLMPRLYSETHEIFELSDQEKLTDIKLQLPIILDDGVDVATNPVRDSSNQKFMDSHLHIVAETYYACADRENNMFFSEKMFKPMQYLQPFVVLNYPYSLKELQRQGYQTFDRWFDESYDTQLDLNQRAIEVAQVVRDFCDQSPQTIAAQHKEMLPVLEHNYHHRIAMAAAMDEHIYDLLHTAFNTPL
jgi:hypothetical protein